MPRRAARSIATIRGKDYATNVLSFPYATAARAGRRSGRLPAGGDTRGAGAGQGGRGAFRAPDRAWYAAFAGLRPRDRRSDAAAWKRGSGRFWPAWVIPIPMQVSHEGEAWSGRRRELWHLPVRPTGTGICPIRPSLLERLSALLMREPEDREQLHRAAAGAFERNLLDARCADHHRGRAVGVRHAGARHHGAARADGRDRASTTRRRRSSSYVIETAHSRFPVIGENRDDVIGILLAKDLLRYFAGKEVRLCATRCGRRCSSPSRSA